jgi:hypothetical protein
MNGFIELQYNACNVCYDGSSGTTDDHIHFLRLTYKLNQNALEDALYYKNIHALTNLKRRGWEWNRKSHSSLRTSYDLIANRSYQGVELVIGVNHT